MLYALDIVIDFNLFMVYFSMRQSSRPTPPFPDKVLKVCVGSLLESSLIYTLLRLFNLHIEKTDSKDYLIKDGRKLR